MVNFISSSVTQYGILITVWQSTLLYLDKSVYGFIVQAADPNHFTGDQLIIQIV